MLFRWLEDQLLDVHAGKHDFNHPAQKFLVARGEDDHLEGVVVQDVYILGHNYKNFMTTIVCKFFRCDPSQTAIFSLTFLIENAKPCQEFYDAEANWLSGSD